MKCIVTGGSNMKITDSRLWKQFIDGLNNPSQEVASRRSRFFEECDKLIITRDCDTVIRVEAQKLNEDELLRVLRGESYEN